MENSRHELGKTTFKYLVFLLLSERVLKWKKLAKATFYKKLHG